MKIGELDADALFLGDSEVSALMVGDVEEWSGDIDYNDIVKDEYTNNSLSTGETLSRSVSLHSGDWLIIAFHGFGKDNGASWSYGSSYTCNGGTLTQLVLKYNTKNSEGQHNKYLYVGKLSADDDVTFTCSFRIANGGGGYFSHLIAIPSKKLDLESIVADDTKSYTVTGATKTYTTEKIYDNKKQLVVFADFLGATDPYFEYNTNASTSTSGIEGMTQIANSGGKVSGAVVSNRESGGVYRYLLCGTVKNADIIHNYTVNASANNETRYAYMDYIAIPYK